MFAVGMRDSNVRRNTNAHDIISTQKKAENVKRFNHKRLLKVIYATQRTDAVDGRAMTLHVLEEIVEIVADCNCPQACAQLKPGFELALTFARMNDIPACSAALTVTLEKIHLIEMANASVN